MKAKAERFRVPDLSPGDRKAWANAHAFPWKVRWVFVAESPHVSEITPVELEERRPLCGASGKKWWALLSEKLTGVASTDVSVQALLGLCCQYQVSVINAVQFPLDPGITRVFPEADPAKTLGFSKKGADSYQKMKHSAAVAKALVSLRLRLSHPALRQAEVHCLGNDALWFVTQAVGANRIQSKIAHPAAWWRRQGFYGQQARGQLTELLQAP